MPCRVIVFRDSIALVPGVHSRHLRNRPQNAAPQEMHSRCDFRHLWHKTWVTARKVRPHLVQDLSDMAFTGVLDPASRQLAPIPAASQALAASICSMVSSRTKSISSPSACASCWVLSAQSSQ